MLFETTQPEPEFRPKLKPEFTPSPDQVVAIKKFKEWITGPSPKFFSMMGPAGTGKTTLAQYMADMISGAVYFCAFTGKAALVMRQSGCPDARTIHSLIYSPTERSKARLREIEAALLDFPDEGPPEALADLQQQLKIEQENMERPMFKLRSDSELRYASLCIIDECSMIDEKMGKDLLSFGVPILALGDPGQLPPVAGPGYFTRAAPNHLLTEIHRQAKESPIIQLATTVRTGGSLQLGQYGNCTVMSKATDEASKAVLQELVLEADQIIVGRNKTRRNINRRVREVVGYPKDTPVPRDKIVCLRNNHDVGLLNGSLWEVLESDVGEDRAWLRIKPYQQPGEELECFAHMHEFQRRKEKLSYWDSQGAEMFDFGYALTCHKSQGSQWGNVLVIDESWSFGENASKHLYTAITRAMNKVTVVI